MANQKITDLNRLNNLDAEDLFIVVDTDSRSNSASPTGETKGITATSLASELTKIANNEVGIDFKNLRDVPDSYEENLGGYIKIKSDGTGIEFTDSPGASEQTFSGSHLQTHVDGEIQTYNIGDILYASSANKFAKASCLSQNSAEAVGIIRKIKYTSDSPTNNQSIEKFSLVFNGFITWDWNEDTIGGPISIEKRPLDSNDTQLTRIYDDQLLVPGTTYFLGTHGTLIEFDPTEHLMLDNVVSKPMLIASSKTSGVIVNYRGLVCNSDEQAQKFIVYEPAACNSIKTGDVLRIKRSKVRTEIDNFGKVSTFNNSLIEESVLPNFLGRESGTTQYALCNAAAQMKTTGDNAPVEDDSYGCDMLGVVINSTSDFFEIQTSGMVEFDMPLYETGDTVPLAGGGEQREVKSVGGIFLTGYTYYIESFPINADQLAGTNQTTELRNSVYDYSPEEVGGYVNEENTLLTTKLRPLLDGTSPFRNTCSISPFSRSQSDGSVIAYAKPAFYAVSPTKILILNQPAYPNSKDTCNAIDPMSGSPCTSHTRRHEQSYTVNRGRLFTGQTEIESFSSKFLNAAWPSGSTNDKATITFIYQYTEDQQEVEKFESYEFVKLDDTNGSFWTYVRKIS
jgi:hypothetical protein